MIKAVVFDVDDTLYDQKAPFVAALAPIIQLPTSFDLTRTFQAYRRQSGQLTKSFLSRKNIAEWEVTRLNTALHAQDLPPVTPEAAAAFQDAYTHKLQHIALFPGLATVLNRLKAQYQLGIITNGQTDYQLAKVMRLHMQRWIDRQTILTSEEAGVAKPDPQIFTMMNRRLKLRASEIVYVGDCYSLDIRAAKQAGWQAFWFNHRNFEIPDGDWTPDQTVESPAELQQLLLALTGVAQL
ncbi:HAD family hydrolase [Levilactobacillus suantsaii]|uniref:HAD family hydrolase n=1 Tax=Levilactobacillus suantsaii TaxID=2292255 RepID=A0A4Q0VJE5_9LACO|nr:HAD family hydrolase [Levilactobacillus suantsaii]RXI79657.1 HAD family hydrolase [Levilactobacillus suantsaii]